MTSENKSKAISKILSRHPIASYISITYLVSWLCWIPIISKINSDVFSSPAWTIFLLLLGGYSPSISAIAVTYLMGGKHASRELLQKLKIMKVASKWYAVSLLAAPLILAISTLLYSAQGGELGWMNKNVFFFLPVFYLVASLFGPIGEELGWRGYLLPRIANKGFLHSSLIVGVIWTFWHAPLYWAAEGTSISGEPVTYFSVLKYLLFVSGTSLLYTYIYHRTRGNIFIAILIHAASNGSHMALAYMFPNIADKKAIWEVEVVIWTSAIIVVVAANIYKLLTKGTKS